MTPLLLNKSYQPKTGLVPRKWHIIDAKDQVLGRVATTIAKILMGKIKPIYTPTVDCGDFVIAINVDKIKLTGNKIEQKIAFHHTAHPGGARFSPYKKMMVEKPDYALYLAVRRMLPKNRLASRQILRLKMYKGTTHPHFAQNPITWSNTQKI